MSPDFSVTVLTSFGLIFLAELGDKTQLICLTLATRHHPFRVWLGASAAFLLLNLAAVLFGSVLADFIPRTVLTLFVAALFAVFAWRSWLAAQASADDDAPAVAKGAGWWTAFTLILIGELGDKTQLSVAGLATSTPPLPVWLGSSLALSASAALAAFIGARLLHKLDPALVHRTAAVVFALFAVLALLQLWR